MFLRHNTQSASDRQINWEGKSNKFEFVFGYFKNLAMTVQRHLDTHYRQSASIPLYVTDIERFGELFS